MDEKKEELNLPTPEEPSSATPPPAMPKRKRGRPRGSTVSGKCVSYNLSIPIALDRIIRKYSRVQRRTINGTIISFLDSHRAEMMAAGLLERGRSISASEMNNLAASALAALRQAPPEALVYVSHTGDCRDSEPTGRTADNVLVEFRGADRLVYGGSPVLAVELVDDGASVVLYVESSPLM